jgi:hypothetical protein
VTEPNRRTLEAAGTDQRERRRSQRVQLAIQVIVRGKMRGAEFEEETATISVSANGCLLHLRRLLERGQQVYLVNRQTTEELPCRVVYSGKREKGKSEVGLEFLEASPLFWRIAFPPADWDPRERKLPPGPNPESKVS